MSIDSSFIVVFNCLQEIPYSDALPLPLRTGHLITIAGITLPKCSRFSFNLRCGPFENSDIAFHFNPRIEENYIVRNSRINGRWGQEETTSLNRMSLAQNQRFKISVFIAPQEFLVAMDDRHFCQYKYRIPVHKVTAITIDGDVYVEKVETTEASEYPDNVLTVTPILKFLKPEIMEELDNPYTCLIEGGLQPGWQVEIIGRIKILPHSFYVNLQEGAQVWPHPQIPLHINPRFIGGQNHVIRNAWLNGSWGHEERSCSKFLPGYQFHMIIRMENEEFSVWVDKKMTGLFKSKAKNVVIDTVVIQGDATIQAVWVNSSVQNIVLDMKNNANENNVSS